MRLSIKAKQVAGVTSIVGLAVVVLSLLHLTSITRVSLEESQSRGELLAHAIYQRAREVVAESPDPYRALHDDPGIRSILESSIAYSKNVTYAAILDSRDVAIAHSFATQVGKPLPRQEDLGALLQQGAIPRLRAIYSDRNFEIRQPLLLGTESFGSIRIGVSTLLIRNDLQQALRPAAATALAALLIAMLVSMSLAQWLLRPIHVIKRGLTRLGRGESGVTLDLPPDDEFGELGSSFNTISAELSEIRNRRAGQGANLESVVEHLEDAVAIFNPEGEALFANSAMRATLPETSTGHPIDDLLPSGHPYRTIVTETLSNRQPRGPVSAALPSRGPDGIAGERLLLTHPIEDRDRRFVGVMLVARNLSYLSQVQSTVNYSRKLAALGRLLAGVAHEVKNPLNAMMIHLELLKQKLLALPTNEAAREEPDRQPVARPASILQLSDSAGLDGDSGTAVEGGHGVAVQAEPTSPPFDTAGVMKHLATIGDEIRRLDQVVQDFLKFARPEELKLQPVDLGALLDESLRVVEPEAKRAGVVIRTQFATALPYISGDPVVLRQAFLNLALNACQAMPDGGVLRIACRASSARHVEVEFEDTGVGIKPEHLERIFDLYFTTKKQGSGIGLSMVYRIIQAHDGEIEVQSTPGHGTRFRMLLPQAPVDAAVQMGK